MPFDNFFEEADKRDFRFGMTFLAVGVLMAFGIWSYNYLPASAGAFDDELPESLTEWRRAERVNNLCREFSLPERFEFVNAQPPQYLPSSTRITYNYRSERDFDEVIPPLLIWFETAGWSRMADEDFKPPGETRRLSRRVLFRKNLSTVEIIYYPALNAYALPGNYQINCSYQEFTLSH